MLLGQKESDSPVHNRQYAPGWNKGCSVLIQPKNTGKGDNSFENFLLKVPENPKHC